MALRLLAVRAEEPARAGARHFRVGQRWEQAGRHREQVELRLVLAQAAEPVRAGARPKWNISVATAPSEPIHVEVQSAVAASVWGARGASRRLEAEAGKAMVARCRTVPSSKMLPTLWFRA